jgi:hypothetical protein
LNVQPTFSSYRPNPNHRASRPVRINPLPAVARSLPKITNSNNGGITPIATPRGYIQNRQDGDRSSGGRTEYSKPSNQPRQTESRNQESPLRPRTSRPEIKPNTDRNSQSDHYSENSKSSDAGKAPQERPRIFQSPSVPQRPSVIPKVNPAYQDPPRSSDSGTVRRFGTPRPPDPAIKASEPKPQERSGNRTASDPRKPNEDSSQGRGNSNNTKSDDQKNSKASDKSDQSSRHARPR